MGMGRMRAGRVSRTCPSLDDAVADPRERDLSDASYPYIRLDATYIKCGDGGRARSTAPVAAVGAGSCGHVRPLGLDARVGDAELHRPHDPPSCGAWPPSTAPSLPRSGCGRPC